MNDESTSPEPSAEDVGIDDLLKSIEAELSAHQLTRQGARAIASARISGLTLNEAIASGVPYEMAKEMAADTWNVLMGLSPIEMVDLGTEE
jgi:hypothetical protein